MQIKTCSQDDIKDLMGVLTQSYLEHYTYLWIDNGANYIQVNFNADRLMEEISDPNAVFFLIFDEEKIAGLIKLNIDSKTDHFTSDTALEIERIYIIKEASGKGLGKKAINFVIHFARQKNKKVIWLKAMDSSVAVDFYKNQGFTIVGETNFNHPEMRREFRKMFLMHLIL